MCSTGQAAVDGAPQPAETKGGGVLAAFQETPYWWEAAPPENEVTGAPPAETDVTIVGAGYCGLCCAVELAENGVGVVVLEAGALGQGASTRNGGMVTGGQKLVVSGATARIGAEQRARLLDDARDSLAMLEARVAKYQLDADYQRSGRVILAHVPSHYRRLERWAELLSREAGSETSLVPRQRLAEEIGGSRYHGGLVIADYGGLHPAKYHRSLRELARKHGAGLHPHAAVTAIERASAGFRVITERGTVHSRDVFVATNGYTGPLIPHLRARVLPVASYIVATEPLPSGLAEHLSPRRRMFSDTRKNLAYFRLSPDGTRVLYGSRPSLLARNPRAVAASLHRQLCEVWPEMHDIHIAYCWTGNVGMTADGLPHMGAFEGIHYAIGCNGSGVAMMSYLGYQSALKIMQRKNRPAAFDSPYFPALPGLPLSHKLVPVVSEWYRARDVLARLVG